MAASVEIRASNKWARVLEKFLNRDGTRVDVGVLDGNTYIDGTNVATVAAVHEFGTDNIPTRSFIRSTAFEKDKGWAALGAAYMHHEMGDPIGALSVMGDAAAKDMQYKIEMVVPPPLNPKTAMAKMKKGYSSPWLPLVETGTMQRAIAFRIVT